MNSEVLEAIGLSLVHSLWQGAALLFLVLLGLVILRNHQAKIRYGITLTGIILLPCVLAANLLLFWPETSVNNLQVQGATFQSSIGYLPADIQPIPNNPQSSSTVLWLQENAATIALFWMVGMALFLLKIIGSFVWMKRLNQKAAHMNGEAINMLLGRVKNVLGIKSQVRIKSSSWIKSPIIIGVIRPTILFPIGLIEGLSIEEVEAILYHELAHFKRNDFVINIIINVLQIVFFYHPAYWWMKSQLDNEREYATDELALQYSEKKLPMIKALAKVQAFSMNHSAIGFAGNSKNQVLKRINIMMNSKQQPNWLSAIFTIAILLVAFGLMSVQDTKSKTDKKDNGTSMEGVLIDLDAQAEKSDSIWPSKPFFIDLDTQIQDNDSTAVSKAILDLIQNRGSFEIELMPTGEIKSISKNGAQLSGKVLKTYESAWHQIDELNSTVKTQEARLNEIQSREENLLKSLTETEKRIQELNPSSSQRGLIEVQKQLVRTQAEYERTLHKYNQISSQAAGANEQELEEFKSKINELNEELERLSKRFHEKLGQNSGRYSLVQFPGGAKNRELFRTIVIKYSLKERDPLLIIDNVGIPGKKLTDLPDSLVLKIQKAEIYTGDRMKEVIGFDKFNDYQEVIRITSEAFESRKPKDIVQFILDEKFELERILLNGLELSGKEKERALKEYRRYRELEILGRESQKLNTIIQSYENQGMNDLEIKGQLLDALNKKDLLSTRISDTYQFIRDNRDIEEIKYASVGVQLKLDSLSRNFMLGNPSQSVFYLDEFNRNTILDNTLPTIEKSGEIMIELDGKLKKGWTINDLKSKVDVNSINVLTIIKGKTMYKYHSERKLGNVSALLKIETKK